VTFVLAMGLGALIWAASPYLTGRNEPWDARSPYYVLALLSAGAVMGLLEPRRFWRWPVAIYLGQCAAIVTLAFMASHGDIGLFFPLGMIVLAMYALISLIGSAAGAAARQWCARLAAKKP